MWAHAWWMHLKTWCTLLCEFGCIDAKEGSRHAFRPTSPLGFLWCPTCGLLLDCKLSCFEGCPWGCHAQTMFQHYLVDISSARGQLVRGLPSEISSTWFEVICSSIAGAHQFQISRSTGRAQGYHAGTICSVCYDEHFTCASPARLTAVKWDIEPAMHAQLMAALKLRMLSFFSRAALHAKLLAKWCVSRRYGDVNQETAV